MRPVPESVLSQKRWQRRWRSLAWRGALLLAVFSAGVTAFELGVGVSDRPGLPEAGALAHIYYTLGLFVLGGMDLGVPVGGTAFARGLLWVSYFAAPAITGFAVIEAVLNAVGPDRWLLRRARGHIVVGGAGKMGLLYLRRLRELHPRKQVVLVDARADHPSTAAAREVYRAMVLHGDIHAELVLAALRLDHVDRVVLLTGDDFANLDAAARILARAPQLASRIVVHVSDLRFMRMMSDTRVARDCHIFNSHQIAASHLVRTELMQWFAATDGRDIVVLAGFGRFGQTVLDELQRSCVDHFDQVIVIDCDADNQVAAFEQQVGFADGYRYEVVTGDLSDPRVWQQIEAPCRLAERSPAFVLGCGDDATNLRSALYVSQRYPKARVVARRFESSSFADEVARDAGFRTISVADLVTASMPNAWFGGK